MKRGTPGHPKFLDLQSALDLGHFATLGILEAIRHFAAEYAHDGALGRFSNRLIAIKIEWTGDPDKLVKALVQTRWLDEHPEHRLLVHDWPDHCEDTVHRRIARARSLFANGQLPKTSGLGVAERKTIEADLARLYPDAWSRVSTSAARLRPQAIKIKEPEQATREPARDAQAAAAEPAGTTGRARAARSRGSRPGSGTRGGLNVTVQDLTEEAACHALYQKAHALGLVHERRGDGVLVPRPRSVACEQAFFTLARYCVRAPRVKDACALFVAKLRRAEWAGDESDQAWALERLRVLHGSPLDGWGLRADRGPARPASPTRRSTLSRARLCACAQSAATKRPRRCSSSAARRRARRAPKSSVSRVLRRPRRWSATRSECSTRARAPFGRSRVAAMSAGRRPVQHASPPPPTRHCGTDRQHPRQRTAHT